MPILAVRYKMIFRNVSSGQFLPHCVFSTESHWSHWLHVFDFPHCAISNVSSNDVHRERHSRNCCICLTFLYCGLSNVSLNYLILRMQSHIGCICLTFSTVHIQMCTQSTCIRLESDVLIKSLDQWLATIEKHHSNGWLTENHWKAIGLD